MKFKLGDVVIHKSKKKQAKVTAVHQEGLYYVQHSNNIWAVPENALKTHEDALQSKSDVVVRLTPKKEI